MKIELLKKLGLVHTNPTESIGYVLTDSPTENIDCDRLLEGRSDCYRLPSQASVHKKRKIIITDPLTRYRLYGNSDNQNNMLMWSELIDQGFEISAWTDELTPITNTADLHKILKCVQPIHHADLAQILATNGLESDEYYLAGIGQTKLLVNAMLDKDASSGMFLSVKDLEKIKQEELSTLLACILAYPVIGLEFSTNEESMAVSSEIFRNFLIQHPVICFIFCESITWEFITQLCKQFPALEYLHLNCCENLGSFTDEFVLSSGLKALVLTDINITWDEISQICKQCPTLESLNLDNVTKLGFFNDKFVLPSSLKTLDLTMTNIIWDELNRFQKMDLKDYDRDDLIAITSMLSGDEISATKMVDAFLNAQQYAMANKIARQPTPRDLFEKVQIKRK